jgi:hypothetical protein
MLILQGLQVTVMRTNLLCIWIVSVEAPELQLGVPEEDEEVGTVAPFYLLQHTGSAHGKENNKPTNCTTDYQCLRSGLTWILIRSQAINPKPDLRFAARSIQSQIRIQTVEKFYVRLNQILDQINLKKDVQTWCRCLADTKLENWCNCVRPSFYFQLANLDTKSFLYFCSCIFWRSTV